MTVGRRGGRARQRGIRLHRSKTLDAAQRTIHDGIPVTTVSRTLIDLADRFDRRTAERALDQAEVLRLTDLTALRAAVDANPGRRGSAVIANLAATYEIGENVTESELEDAFLRLCDHHGIPRPDAQRRLGDRRLDFVWTEQRVAIEVDSMRWHGGRSAREHDHRRDIDVQLRGFKPGRFSYRRVLYEDAAVAADVTALLRS